MTQALVIAYGNPLRGDDGAAWAVADELRHVVPESVQLLYVHQLSPELADTMHHFGVVLFLDVSADVDAKQVLCLPVTVPVQEIRFWHHIGPSEVLALAKQLYASSTQGFLLTIPGRKFSYGFALSDTVKSAIPRAVAEVCALLEHCGVIHTGTTA